MQHKDCDNELREKQVKTPSHSKPVSRLVIDKLPNGYNVEPQVVQKGYSPFINSAFGVPRGSVDTVNRGRAISFTPTVYYDHRKKLVVEDMTATNKINDMQNEHQAAWYRHDQLKQ